MRSNDAMARERPRLLVLDLLESYTRERDTNVLLERRREQDEWVCVLKSGKSGSESRCVGKTARPCRETVRFVRAQAGDRSN